DSFEQLPKYPLMKKITVRYLLVILASLTTALLPISVLAAPGDLYEADYSSNTIFKFTPAGTKTPFASGLGGPLSLAFDGSGNLFETDLGSNTIFKFAPDGTKTPFITGLDGPRALAFDATGNLFVGENTMISKITQAGIKTLFASGLAPYLGLAFDNSGNLFESDLSGSIFIFTPAGTKSTFASALSTPAGLSFAPTPHKLFNISTRGFVGTGDAVLIGGF